VGKTENQSVAANGEPAAPTTEDSLYTPRQFAERINRSVSTLKLWEKKGILIANRYPSGQRYYTQAQLDTLLNPPKR
jgi:hypothetical protein